MLSFLFFFFLYFSYVFIRVSEYKNVIHNKRKIHENTKKPLWELNSFLM